MRVISCGTIAHTNDETRFSDNGNLITFNK
jgi:hypothetical protein